jgi:hypothetical protein
MLKVQAIRTLKILQKHGVSREAAMNIMFDVQMDEEVRSRGAIEDALKDVYPAPDVVDG